MKHFLPLLLAMGPLLAHAQQPVSAAQLAPNAPPDRPVRVAGRTDAEAASSLAVFERHIAPAVQQARATLPQARRRFEQGLPAGQLFFVTTRLHDPDGKMEQVFVRVRQWQGTQVSGLVASELGVITSFRQGQLITFPEAEVLDWTISRPDGTEEGNYVGKLMDADNR